MVLGVTILEQRAGLVKQTNANRSISKVNDLLFPIKLTEIADWKSSTVTVKFQTTFTRVTGGNLGAHTSIMPLPYQVIIS